MPDRTLAHASAPGKLVLAGEYAVLAGAPAVVAAIDRRVTCRISGRGAGAWSFRSRGFEARSTHSADTLPTASGDPATLVGHALRRLGIDPGSLPEHLGFEIDSRPCYRGNAKLGLGSSAAATVAVAAAVSALGGIECTLPQVLAIHRDLQGGSGSGLDVAAAFRGGVIRYQSGGARSIRLPDDIHCLFVYAGWATDTRDLVQRFDAWRDSGDPPQLRRLVECAEAVAEPAGPFLDRLAEYVDALEALDRAAGIGIVSEPHAVAATLARRHGMLYKPCGAGGGDMGVALSKDDEALAAFGAAVAKAGLQVVSGSIDPVGVRVS